MQESRGGGSDGKTCSLPNGIRTGPVTNDVVANSRDQPNQRAHSTNAGTVTTTHGRLTRIARNVWAGLVPSTCEAAQPPRPLTTQWSGRGTSWRLFPAAHRQRSGAPFNGARDCSFREPYVDNGMRTMQRASMVGNHWGLEPAKKRAAAASHTRRTARVL